MEINDKSVEHPVVTFEDGTINLKPEAEWTDAKDEEALENSKALNVIFNGVDKNMFRLINIYSEAKKLRRFSQLHMKTHPKFVCQSCSFLPLSLRI